MRRYPSRVLLRLAAAVVLSAAISCASGDRPEGGEAPAVVTGVVVEIESRGLDEVESFTVKDGERRFTILVDENTDFSFTPSHLNEHRATGEPVAVEVDRRGGKLVAVTVEDG
jgi:hypothetical protein